MLVQHLQAMPRLQISQPNGLIATATSQMLNTAIKCDRFFDDSFRKENEGVLLCDSTPSS
ncbi:hypothetical protein [Coleofasciculus sp. FACHB-129]|uniref:hypothetical protein n=2 Tax=Cyanophyceae TaxID=3028117 RepID=UPI0018EF63A4|nr:hypothetical protein [Coleofasciculus sp. FACHB-129]